MLLQPHGPFISRLSRSPHSSGILMRPYDCAGPAANKSTAGAQHTLRLHCGFVYIRWLPQRVAQYCSSMRMSTVTTGHVHNRAAVFTVPSRPACRRAERELQESEPEAAGRVRALRNGLNAQQRFELTQGDDSIHVINTFGTKGSQRRFFPARTGGISCTVGLRLNVNYDQV